MIPNGLYWILGVIFSLECVVDWVYLAKGYEVKKYDLLIYFLNQYCGCFCSLSYSWSSGYSWYFSF